MSIKEEVLKEVGFVYQDDFEFTMDYITRLLHKSISLTQQKMIEIIDKRILFYNNVINKDYYLGEEKDIAKEIIEELEELKKQMEKGK